MLVGEGGGGSGASLNSLCRSRASPPLPVVDFGPICNPFDYEKTGCRRSIRPQTIVWVEEWWKVTPSSLLAHQAARLSVADTRVLQLNITLTRLTATFLTYVIQMLTCFI